jgi:hypothetical protein
VAERAVSVVCRAVTVACRAHTVERRADNLVCRANSVVSDRMARSQSDPAARLPAISISLRVASSPTRPPSASPAPRLAPGPQSADAEDARDGRGRTISRPSLIRGRVS